MWWKNNPWKSSTSSKSKRPLDKNNRVNSPSYIDRILAVFPKLSQRLLRLRKKKEHSSPGLISRVQVSAFSEPSFRKQIGEIPIISPLTTNRPILPVSPAIIGAMDLETAIARHRLNPRAIVNRRITRIGSASHLHPPSAHRNSSNRFSGQQTTSSSSYYDTSSTGCLSPRRIYDEEEEEEEEDWHSGAPGLGSGSNEAYTYVSSSTTNFTSLMTDYEWVSTSPRHEAINSDHEEINEERESRRLKKSDGDVMIRGKPPMQPGPRGLSNTSNSRVIRVTNSRATSEDRLYAASVANTASFSLQSYNCALNCSALPDALDYSNLFRRSSNKVFDDKRIGVILERSMAGDLALSSAYSCSGIHKSARDSITN